ncbi:uncharacterized protein MONBRDRAFT_32379 [Monosiga brevicollis MX1]|uniref:Glycosyltransferase 2-like domain-containing protein n=1 Tax=Monosiga brevicollis TaxID=81824 RepID=A9UZ60_MONBE|nr:uncharacterized protein MONBRDRAFT_32379 [Monosiga brevicollis MX1]EDQ89309.1 predicted protein [Monosiga brevicollis MX1]|eukprot:XP_001745885.1 hypothetical protein [Monosiga brevicollis MX1]
MGRAVRVGLRARLVWLGLVSVAIWHRPAMGEIHEVPDAPVSFSDCPSVRFSIKYAPAAPGEEGAIPKLEIVPEQALAANYEETPTHPTMFALMITGKDQAHEYFARHSMLSFAHQSAARKVLVVINDSPNYTLTGPPAAWLSEASPGIMSEPPHCVVEVRIEPGRYTLGDLRNIGINAVPLGGVWVQWDDDDWHERQYMRLKAEKMASEHKHAMTIKSQIRYFFAKNSSYVYAPKSGFGIEGTVMVFKTPTVAPIQYRAQGKSEDSFFIMDIRRAKVPSGVWDNPPNLYFRFFHGINTWNGVHYQINKLPGDNAWCSDLETQTFGCESEMDNELHHFVRRTYVDVAAALAAAPKEA